MTFDATKKLTRKNLAQLPPLCADGAWGTELQKLGLKPGALCDAWNLEHPDRVQLVALSYVNAGAQVILTNTFGSNRIMLKEFGLSDQAADLSRAGAEISKAAAQGRAYVFGSIGPCGKMVRMDEVPIEKVEAAAAEQAAALAEGGADAILIETQSDAVEAAAALKGALSACKLPVGVSFTFDAGASNDRTMMGDGIEDAYALARDNGASFVGANCGAGIETFVDIAKAYSACGSELPIWIKGNAGLPEVGANGKAVFSGKPQDFAEVVKPLLDAGARFIGGCCGSTPHHIEAIAGAMGEALRA